MAATRSISLRWPIKNSTPVTDDWYSADNATFSDDGKYLMLTSSRDFKPISTRPISTRVSRPGARVSRDAIEDTENPLGPRSDEVGKKKDKDKDKEKADDKGKDADKDKARADKKPATMRRRR